MAKLQSKYKEENDMSKKKIKELSDVINIEELNEVEEVKVVFVKRVKVDLG